MQKIKKIKVACATFFVCNIDFLGILWYNIYGGRYGREFYKTHGGCRTG